MTTDKLQGIAEAVGALDLAINGIDTSVSGLDGTLDLVLDHMHQRFDVLEKIVIEGFTALGVTYAEPPSATVHPFKKPEAK